MLQLGLKGQGNMKSITADGTDSSQQSEPVESFPQGPQMRALTPPGSAVSSLNSLASKSSSNNKVSWTPLLTFFVLTT